ncbi:endoglucanase precursor [Anaerotignum neopropionicum]|uniref:Endoglucanase n=1 Tax=Anaerotignum neopropionicum TaxID=36847 RepID=A0A136WEN6_9FIRM|nr:S-layer homology domain-containing protein [Anaerotignum neopropionicum]KXL52975.1 endoglucanase precursor [Anaerotignum neopropionicum]
MKKRFFSILLCFCMVLGLLPATALATDGPDFSNLNEGETVTIDGTDYTYKGDGGGGGGIEMITGIEKSYMALQEAYCWKAGDGYVLYTPTLGSVDYRSVDVTTSAVVTLHNAEITSDAYALKLPDNQPSATNFPVDVTVKVEGENRLSTSNGNYCVLVHQAGDITFMGEGTLRLENTETNANDNFYNSNGVVTIQGGTQVAISGGRSRIVGNLIITDSDSKLTIASGTTLSMGSVGGSAEPNVSTVTVENGAVLENNGTLNMNRKTKDQPGIFGEISGGGGIQFDYGTLYCLVDGEFIPYGGDIKESGLDLSSSQPTEVTRYKAGNGYALFTPAEGGAKAKLELNNATINTTDATALNLLTAEPVDITVTGNNSLTAGGSKDVIYTNGQALSVTGEGNLNLAGSYYGVNVNGMGAVSISIDGNLTFDTASQPISTAEDVTVSAKSITSNSGYPFYSGGTVSLTATDGDIVFDDTGKTYKQEKIVGTNDITLNAPSGKIDITHGGGGYALNSTSGTITVTAQNDVIINASNGGSINSGKSDTSDVVSVNSTNGSIQMSCGDSYECVKSSGGVALTAAKDITLNGTGMASVAIHSSNQNVSITAGSKLTSTSAYGFKVGTLTIQANEVSIAGTIQDGILASSVSITNTDGTDNCKSVSITGTSGSDSWAAINSSNVNIKADDVLICGNNKAKAIIAPNDQGTVTIGDAGMIIGAVSISGANAIDSRILCIESTGTDASTGLDLSTPPTVTTYYKAGDGYALFTPANGETKATLTLHNASITSSSATPLDLGAETVIKLEGTNSITNSNETNGSVGISAISSSSGIAQPVTIQGGSDDSLTVSAWQCTRMGALTIDGCSVTMDGECYGINTEGNVILKNGAKVSASGGDFGDAVHLADLTETEQYSLTVSEGSALTVEESSALITGDLTISGSKVTINSGVEAMVLGAVNVENSGVLENNGIWQMKLGTTVEQIKALKLTGNGVVRVYTNEDDPPTFDTYTNEGDSVKEISGGLDLTTGGGSGTTVAADGYEWNDTSNTLTLGDIIVSGDLTVPDGTTINTTSSSTIIGDIGGASGSQTNLIFTGSAPLIINGSISLDETGDSVTVQDGVDITVNGSLSAVVDSTLNVIGSGTTLNLFSQERYAVLCDGVNVGNGATLNVTSRGTGSVGIATNGNVNVTGGSTLSAGCDYGVYIIDGTLTVDSSSKLVTNGSVAPFCVVDKSSSKGQEDTVNIPDKMLPQGTGISSIKGISVFSEKKYTYWSLIKDEALGVTGETAMGLATLTGAAKGELTFKKAKKSSSGSSGGGVSITRTLTFDTNGGSDIASVTKTNGAVVDLKDYKPTREGYTFAGWYSDKALTKKITSETLAASTTVYAKWIENVGETTESEETKEKKETKKSFTDVKDSDYYYDAVQWAVENGVTSGTTDTTFDPSSICTRAQMVTFLWRAMGSPEPTAANCAFNDVSKDTYYYKAVLWAVENNITAGATTSTFEPNATVTRGQTGTFLWRGAGKPTATIANPYTDVAKGAYNYDAILWAAENGITQGTGATTFSPEEPCTRGQIVTFLLKYTKN